MKNKGNDIKGHIAVIGAKIARLINKDRQLRHWAPKTNMAGNFPADVVDP